MVRRVTRAAAIAGAAVTISATLGGCGGSSTPAGPSAGTLVAAAPEKTTQAGTARVAFTAVTEILGQHVEFSGHGVFDFAGPRGRLTFSLPSLLGDRTVTELLVGDNLYLKIPGVSPDGKFFAFDLKALGDGENPFSQLGNADPTAGLEALRGVSSDVREAGTATLRGTPTTKYAGTIDTALAVEKAPAALRDKVRSLLKAVDTIPFEAYLDEDGRLRQLHETLSIPASDETGGQPVTAELNFEIYDFGVPVSVRAPAEKRTASAEQLIALLSRGGG